MTLREFRELTADLPEDYQILRPNREHGYDEVDLVITTALHDSQTGVWTEDFGDDYTPESTYGRRKEILEIAKGW